MSELKCACARRNSKAAHARAVNKSNYTSPMGFKMARCFQKISCSYVVSPKYNNSPSHTFNILRASPGPTTFCVVRSQNQNSTAVAALMNAKLAKRNKNKERMLKFTNRNESRVEDSRLASHALEIDVSPSTSRASRYISTLCRRLSDS